MNKNWYFIDSKEKDASYNMEFDSELLNQSLNNKIDLPVLRVYAWNEPTISLGFNQKEVNTSSLNTVKRITGGQAVFHDTKENELTYSVVLCTNDSPKKVYFKLSNVLIVFLKKCGLNAVVGYKNEIYTNKFNCFESKTEADIVVNDVKVIGSAQRVKRKLVENNKKQYVLQHGSIRLDKIKEFSGRDISYEKSSEFLKSAFMEELKIGFLDLKEVINV